MARDYIDAVAGKTGTIKDLPKVIAELVEPDEELKRLVSCAVRSPEEESRLLFVLAVIAHIVYRDNEKMKKRAAGLISELCHTVTIVDKNNPIVR